MSEDGTPVISEAVSVSTTLPTDIQGDAPQDNSEFLSTLPEAYKDKPWVKEFTSVEGILKSWEDKSASLSRRPSGIPDANASPEDLAAFNKAMGVPDAAGDYQLAAYPEGYEPTEADTQWQSDIKDLFLESGQTPAQATKLEAGWNKMVEAFTQQQEVAQGKSDAEFDTLTAEIYGDTAAQVLANGKSLIESHVNEKVKPFVAGLDNKAMMVVASVLDSIKKEYIGEDNLPGASAVAPSMAMTNDDISAKAREIMASKPYSDPSDRGHESAKKQVQELYSKLKY